MFAISGLHAKKKFLVFYCLLSPFPWAEMQGLGAYSDHVDRDKPQRMAEQQNRSAWALDDPNGTAQPTLSLSTSSDFNVK